MKKRKYYFYTTSILTQRQIIQTLSSKNLLDGYITKNPLVDLPITLSVSSKPMTRWQSYKIAFYLARKMVEDGGERDKSLKVYKTV